MVTMVVKADRLNHEAFHDWLDNHDPEWTWMIPRRKGVATTLSAGRGVDSKDRERLDWHIAGEHVLNSVTPEPNTYLGYFRVHYKISNKDVAMLAKLTWGNMRPFRTGTSA